jgi:capsid protein
LTNKINADGFVKALISDDFMVFEAYLQCRFVGRNMPHIDPLKEVKAIREALGDDRTPLISREQATEGLGFGDFHENIQEYNEENNKFNLVQDDNTETNDNQ